MKKLFCLGLAMALSSAAFAYASLTGPTGLVNVPTAAVEPAGQISVAIDGVDTKDNVTVPVRVLYGAMENLEVGASASFQDKDEVFGLNAKYQTPLAIAGFNWAGGAQYARYNLNAKDDDELWQLYWTGTREFTEATDTMPSFTGTVGVNWTKFENFDGKFRAFAGLKAGFANNFSLTAEVQSDSDIDEDTLWSVVGRYSITPVLGAQVGYTNGFETMATDDSEVFAGISYVFGKAD